MFSFVHLYIVSSCAVTMSAKGDNADAAGVSNDFAQVDTEMKTLGKVPGGSSPEEGGGEGADEAITDPRWLVEEYMKRWGRRWIVFGSKQWQRMARVHTFSIVALFGMTLL